MLQSRRGSCFVVDSSKTQAHHESPQRHVGAFVVWNLPIGLQRSRSQLEFEVNLRPKFRGNPGFREIPVWRWRRCVRNGKPSNVYDIKYADGFTMTQECDPDEYGATNGKKWCIIQPIQRAVEGSSDSDVD
jgi:hypothetical protein